MVRFHLFSVVVDEHCQRWEHEFIEVIDTEKKDSEYTFYKESRQSSCQLEPLISYRNGTTGEWQFFNLSGNVLALHTGPSPGSSLKIKVFFFSKFILEAIQWTHALVTSNSLYLVVKFYLVY